jgi:hypothetical protein
MWLYHTDSEISETINDLFDVDLTADAVKQKRQALRLKKSGRGVPLIVQESPTQRFKNAPVLNLDNVCIMADIHAPFHDADWCSNVIHQARGRGIKTVVIPGDLFDMAALTSFTPAMIAEDGTETLLTDELMAAADFADALLTVFDRVLITLGNHEMRLARKLGRLSVKVFEMLLGFHRDDAVTVSEYAYCKILDSNGQKWRITHPKNSSIIPVRVAARLTEKYESHIVAAHGHDWGEATGASGRYAAACGMCADPWRIEYTTKIDSTRPLMQQGAWFLIDGKPTLLHPVYRPEL